ncbi:hypothetical protein NE237_023120 [Protea cynaroides]|uniref:Uncharacterized protein n=1 Tax=Protea cynaroides TaxID=273540 RepID=A0A9Q0K4U6_9MAGN|nr:hypothetical protein NE237_023120 [Protea cynaroides]
MRRLSPEVPNFCLFISGNTTAQWIQLMLINFMLSFSHSCMAQGHLIPFVDMARLFSSHGVKVTIITTPLNACLFSNTIDRDKQLGLDIFVHLIPFPSEEAGLAQGYENASSFPNFSAVAPKFFNGLNFLQQTFEELLQEHHPDFVFADMCFP